MFEKVNPAHPDKVADRIAGAIVDKAYEVEGNPRIAVELLIGHGNCTIIVEASPVTSEWLHKHRMWVDKTVECIAGCEVTTLLDVRPQDAILSHNQDGYAKCGDNGIFKGVWVTQEQKFLTALAKAIYAKIPYDGKYIYDTNHHGNVFDENGCPLCGELIICQSHATNEDILAVLQGEFCWGNNPDSKYRFVDFVNTDRLVINPLGEWTGGINVDTGAVNRKLGSDMGDAVTGGGLHGKDVSKADIAINTFLHCLAQATGGVTHTASCAIGDTNVMVRAYNGTAMTSLPYNTIMHDSKTFIQKTVGGFEKLAEWGLIR